MDRPISAKVIYDTIAADSDIVNALGTYEFRKGQIAPAISIVSPGADLPLIRNVSGVECIIQDTGDVTPMNFLTEGPNIHVQWSVFLVCFEPATGGEMTEIVGLICKRFANSYSIQTVATPDGAGSLVQTKIIIDSKMPILSKA